MNCPYCSETTTQKRTKKTKLGYTTFFCQGCRRTFNERTGTSLSMENGAISIEPLMGMAIWLIHGGVEKRDRDAAKQFLKQAMAVVGHAPEYVTTDGHRSYPRAIRETVGNEVKHRTNVYLNNRIEREHRGIKQRYYPMRGFGNFVSAARFCRTAG
jgi:DDE superfamily endonuclease